MRRSVRLAARVDLDRIRCLSRNPLRFGSNDSRKTSGVEALSISFVPPLPWRFLAARNCGSLDLSSMTCRLGAEAALLTSTRVFEA